MHLKNTCSRSFSIFNRSRLPALIGVLSLMGLLLFGLGKALTQSQPVFRIGLINDANDDIQRGAALAVEQLNAGGGVLGADGTRFRLELVTQPDTDIPSAIANINQASVIAVVGPATSAAALGNLNALQGLQVPVLTMATDDTLINNDNSGRLFRIRAREALRGRALADYLVNDLGINRLATVQLDVASTVGVVGFTRALSTFGVQPAPFLLQPPNELGNTVQQIINNNYAAVVVYGPLATASDLLSALRNRGWQGEFAYNRVDETVFREGLSNAQLQGVLSTNTWSYTAQDEASVAFLADYVGRYGSVPGDINAAAYDAVQILAEGISRPNALRNNLLQISNFQGVQGVLQPALLTSGEMSDNVTVTRLNEFAVPQVVARYSGADRLPIEEPQAAIITPTPSPTATPDGVVMTVQSAVQNVRTGPSINYPVIGQLEAGEQRRVIGANLELTWVVIDFRGQQGWMAASLLDFFGDLDSLPIITPPPTPTPPPPTTTPTPTPTADVIIVSATPNRLTLGSPFTLNVTVRNQGRANAGAFAVAATFQPGGIYSAVNLNGLAAGQQTTVNLMGTLTGSTGNYSVVIVADLNDQVNEGPTGEANNDDFLFNYSVDRPILNAGTLTLAQGGTLTLEGSGAIDILWDTDNNLKVQNSANIYLMNNVSSLDQVTYDTINPAAAGTAPINVALLPNAYVGVITAEGNRGVLQINNVASGGPLTVTYRVYQP